jgi:hypothetical protein
MLYRFIKFCARLWCLFGLAVALSWTVQLTDPTLTRLSEYTRV